MTLFASFMDGKCFGKPEGGSADSVSWQDNLVPGVVYIGTQITNVGKP